MHRAVRVGLGLAAVALLVTADATTKTWATGELRSRGPRLIAAGQIELRYRENRGMVFGLFRERAGNATPRFIFIYSAAVTLGLATLLALRLRSRAPGRMTLAGLITLFAGNAGNLLDRWRWSWVVDFIEIVPGGRRGLPAFNLADGLIAVGIVLCLPALVRGLQARGV